MTCIVGLVDRGRVYIGGDSAGVGGYSITQRADLKVFENGSYIFGFAGSFRMGQLLQYSLRPPRPDDDSDLMRFMVMEFVDELRCCLKHGGMHREKNGEESIPGGLFLVGYKDRLFRIDCDYQVGESCSGFEAIGCGEDFALGSLFTTKGSKNPKARVLEALKAAEQFSSGVCGPFHIVHTR